MPVHAKTENSISTTNTRKDCLQKCDCWAAKEGSDSSGPYIFCILRAIYLSKEESRIRSLRALRKCPGATKLRETLHARKQQEMMKNTPLSLSG